MLLRLSGICLGLIFAAAGHAESPKKSAKEALQPFNALVGSWRATGTPEGSKEQKQRGFWTETHLWEWKFKGEDAWIRVEIEKGKHFSRGELRHLPQKDAYELKLTTATGEALVFNGVLKDRVLTLEREDKVKNETQRLVFSLIHDNRFLYRYEVKQPDKALFAKHYQVGATKEGVPFATGDGKPECIVSGGLGTMPVTYKGQTYYVCCSGCRDEFKEDPEKYIKEFEAKKAKGKKP